MSDDINNMGHFILLHPSDNVLVCRESAPSGQTFSLDGEIVSLSEDITVGHKIARRNLNPGDKVIKYGAPIGSMTVPALRGAHVHLHNMQSDYLPSHTREATGHAH